MKASSMLDDNPSVIEDESWPKIIRTNSSDKELRHERYVAAAGEE